MSIDIDYNERTSADLLREAVHRNDGFSIAGVLEWAFAFAFRTMVYPQIWEDPRIDMEALEIAGSSRVIAISSGGCNVMSYLTAQPAEILAVDLNDAHVALLRLKIAAALSLPDHASFFAFFGSANDAANPPRYDRFISPYLDKATRLYWEGRTASGQRRITRFSRNFYRYGLLGSFIGAGHLAARLLGADPRILMKARNLEEQRELFASEIEPLFERRIIKWIVSRRASLFGLGIPPAQYDALCNGGARPMHEVLRERLRRLAADFNLCDNYFAWQAFGRAYAPLGEGPCPPYLERENFARLKLNAGRVRVLKRNFTHMLDSQPDASLDRYVLLDAQDWMNDEALAALWRAITRTARPGARVIFRTAGERTILPGRVPPAILSSWTYEAKKSRALHARDRSAIYGGFHLYTRAPA